MKSKHTNYHRIKIDPKAMPRNLSKRKKVAKDTMKPCSMLNEISVEQSAGMLDQGRTDQRKP